MNTIRKIFTVLVNNKEYDVYSIEGKEHPVYNDIPKTWWLYYSDRLPDGMIPPMDSPYLEPFNAEIERRVWDLKFTQKTTTKEKWGETRFNSHTWCSMICNGRLIYEFGTAGGDRGMNFAMAKAQYLQTVLGEHSYNFFEPEKEEGRKICWYGLPAFIKVCLLNTWEIKIIPDYTTGLTKEEWWKELQRRETKYSTVDEDFEPIEREYREGDIRNGYINWGDALSDQHIYWFRK